MYACMNVCTYVRIELIKINQDQGIRIQFNKPLHQHHNDGCTKHTTRASVIQAHTTLHRTQQGTGRWRFLASYSIYLLHFLDWTWMDTHTHIHTHTPGRWVPDPCRARTPGAPGCRSALPPWPRLRRRRRWRTARCRSRLWGDAMINSWNRIKTNN